MNLLGLTRQRAPRVPNARRSLLPMVICVCMLAGGGSVCLATAPATQPAPDEVRAALNRAARFFGEQVAVEGGYVWEVSSDLKIRRGEEDAGTTQIWIQPPGTPSVGMAFLRAYQRTGDEYCLSSARRAAHALAWGQLSTGGWDYRICFAPAEAKRYHYRRDVEAGDTDAGSRKKLSVFDDDTSQSALCMLMEFDRATGMRDQVVRRAVDYALDHFLKVQRPNGGWPQRFDGPCKPEQWPMRRARYPETWSRAYAREAYHHLYTLNDDVVHDLIRTMLLAHEIYGKQAYLDSAIRTGEFLLTAQMPEPQPGWAQQYNANMEPAWARKFEPPAIVTRESVPAIQSLGELYVRTGDERFLKPIRPFLEWLDRCRLPDGRFARFYELRTNRPLYFNGRYELVYTDDDTPTHYAFKVEVDLPRLRRWYEGLRHQRRTTAAASVPSASDQIPPAAKPERIRQVLSELDEHGRWLDSDGRISSQMFIRNLDLLSAWLKHQAAG